MAPPSTAAAAQVRHPTAQVRHLTAQVRHPTAQVRHPTAQVRSPSAPVRGPTALALRPAEQSFDASALVRRLTVVIAAGTGVVGLLFGRPLLATSLRAGAVLVLGLFVCALLGRIARRPRPGGAG